MLGTSILETTCSRFLDGNWSRVCYAYYRMRQKAGLLAPPEDVQWLATSRCNLHCRHCGTDAGAAAPGELTTNEIKGVLDELAALGTTYLTLTGGEPLMRKDLFEVLHYAAGLGIQYNIVTNAAFVPDFEHEFGKLPPASVKVSIDGPPETHAYIRGDRGNFEACMHALTFFKTLGIDTRVICTTLNQRNIGEVEELFRYVRSSDATLWEFHRPTLEGRAAVNSGWMYLTQEQLTGLFRFIMENQHLFPIFMGEGCGYTGAITRRIYDGRRFFCGAGWSTFTIMHDGSVAGCPAFEKQWTEGSVREKSVTELWRTGFTRFREIYRNLDDECRRCRYLSACHGGCWMHRRTGDHCLKEVWENMTRA
jgi:radical SAM protein with 4Fe4S-binding SPASM domain